MAAANDLFTQLKDELTKFETFLKNNVDKIKPAVKPLDQLTGGRITDLINKLITLMGSVKTEVDKLANNPVPGLTEITQFASGITSFLQAVETLLPQEKTAIDDISSVVSVVTSLPSVKDVQAELDKLIDSIVADLKSLTAP